MSTAVMRDLPRGTEFRLDPYYGVPTRYRVTVPAAEHPDGEVGVRNLDMTDAEAARMLATPGAVEPGCDPRDGVFVARQIECSVEVLA